LPTVGLQSSNVIQVKAGPYGLGPVNQISAIDGELGGSDLSELFTLPAEERALLGTFTLLYF
jgi:hypothetical protein